MSYSFEVVINISHDIWYPGFSQQFSEDERLLEWYPVQTEVINSSEKHSASSLHSAGALDSGNYYQLQHYDIPKELRLHFRETCCFDLYKTN